MKLFVTGATGYLGYHFVNVAVSQGHKVLCLRRHTSKSLFEEIVEKEITWVNVEDEDLKEKVASFGPDILVHCAWGGVRGSDRNNKEVQWGSVTMSQRMFELYPYKQIIALGSQDEYGYYTTPVSEDAQLNLTSEYGFCKRQCCENLKTYCEENSIEWQWIRVFTIFGEKQTGGLIRAMVNACQREDKEFDTTQGDQRYSYLYSFDFARALCNVLGTKGKPGIYNLSQPIELHSNREILRRIKEYLQSDIQINYGAIPYVDGQIMLMDGVVTKFENTFGSIPHTDFDFALNNTIDSLLK